MEKTNKRPTPFPCYWSMTVSIKWNDAGLILGLISEHTAITERVLKISILYWGVNKGFYIYLFKGNLNILKNICLYSFGCFFNNILYV